MKNKFPDNTSNIDNSPEHNQERTEKGEIKLLDAYAQIKVAAEQGGTSLGECDLSRLPHQQNASGETVAKKNTKSRHIPTPHVDSARHM